MPTLKMMQTLDPLVELSLTQLEPSPAQKLLKEIVAKLPHPISKSTAFYTIKEWLFKTGNLLAMLEELEICDELIKDAIAYQKELAKNSQNAKEGM